MQLNKDFSQNGSLKRISRLAGDSGDETINRLKKTMYAKDERITQLERTIVELQRRLHEETERKNCALGALNDNFESKIKQFEDEKAAKDRRIALLSEDRGKLGEILDVSAKERDDDAALGMHKMEEIRQKIQERKRKGRMCAAGGLIGMGVDHSRSSSGSLLPPGSHIRRLHEETERKNCALGALNDNFESKIKQFEDEKAAKDRRIALLSEDRGKLGEILDVSAKERDDDAALGMHKMEEIRQKIQERKRKGRMCAAGGLIGMGVDHSRSSSGSLLPPGSHIRLES
ncbi:hypothetical protein ANCCAN_21576 [Ancylostoma caninum]|uniref:Uncharacterized protein n=1 Tax=Ancylostoma caninum TaxID=29170 RepID=A0A368FK53_ANCCA|nr:hypothetical protein ANCCAN_21576 [Ancylostoma caninum]